MTPVSPSPIGPSPSPWTQRLVEQLQQLSELTESLTYRLLELEERVLEGERELDQLRKQVRGGEEISPAMESWLTETEERLVRVEELLQRSESRTAPLSRPLMAVSPIQRSSTSEAAPESDAIDPFPDEGEQPFLDEQIA